MVLLGRSVEGSENRPGGGGGGGRPLAAHRDRNRDAGRRRGNGSGCPQGVCQPVRSGQDGQYYLVVAVGSKRNWPL